MSEQTTPQPPAEEQQPAPTRLSNGKRAFIGTAVAAGLAVAGTFSPEATGNNNDTTPVIAEAAPIVDEQPDGTLPETLSADPIQSTLEIEPTTTTTTTPPAPVQAPVEKTEVSATSTATTDQEIDNQDVMLQELNPKVGDEVTCLVSNRELAAGSKVLNQAGELVEISENTIVKHPNLRSLPEEMTIENEREGGLYFWHNGEISIIPLSNQEFVDITDAVACKVTAVGERQQITATADGYFADEQIFSSQPVA